MTTIEQKLLSEAPNIYFRLIVRQGTFEIRTLRETVPDRTTSYILKLF